MSRFLIVYVFLIVVVVFGTNAQNGKGLAKDRRFKLNSGDLMPLIGFGTYLINGTATYEVLDKVLAAGYRLIDTAKIYLNEEDIGRALKLLLPKYGLTRQDIWITTKLSPRDQGSNAYQFLQESLRKLGMDYVDLYLIHWPGAVDVDSKANFSRLRDESWQGLVKGVKTGLAKNIGVSNYLVKHLKELLANDHGIKPAVNQVEWHPYYHPNDLLDFCRKEGILLQAYSSLGGSGSDSLLRDPIVQRIAQKLRKTPAQILLNWALQQNIAVIPKASSRKHINENIDLNFVIPEEDMKTLSSIPSSDLFYWNPNDVE